MSVNESPVTLRWWRLMSCMMLTSSFSTRWVPLEVPPASGLCHLQGCFFFHRVVTSPGAPAAEPSAGCLWRTPTRASTLQSVAWTCCWTVSTIRSAAEKQHPTFHHPSEYAQLCLYGRSGLSRFPSWCLGLQHRHDPHRPSRLWSVSVQYPRIECFRYCKCTDHWVCVLVMSWEGFSGARVLALPGDISYALRHGVYLSDKQVLTLLVLFWSRAAH